MSPGLLVYRGPSRLDGAPIVAVVTRDSHNTKTGPMAQAWVIRSDQSPMDAIRAGEDRSICGDCVHRSGGVIGRSCYVIPHQGPTNVYKAFQRGIYRELTASEASLALQGEMVRVTAYGDPAAVPLDVWRSLLVHAAGHTCYSHQWRTCDQRFRELCMASVESEAEAEQAHALGWRTFRARLATEPVRTDEIVCPGSDEARHATTCQACRLCVGTARPAARSIAIIAHGQRVSWLRDKKELVTV